MVGKVRWLLVGPGDISQKRAAPALAAAANSQLVGVVYNTRREQAQALADKFGARQVFGDFPDALAKSDADAVYLATPVWLHRPQAVQALESGRHVLVEKPLGLNAADCAAIVAAADRTGRTAACAYYRRCYPRYRHAAEAIAKGELGRIVQVRMSWQCWYDPQPADPKYWRVVLRKSGGGPLMDIGSHMLDLMVGLFGLPASVCGWCGNMVHHWDVEDCASVFMTLANGAHAVASVNWNSKTWRHEFEIVGAEARLHWPACDGGPVVKTVGREVTEIDMPNAGNVHLPLVQDFVDAVREGRAPVCPVQEAAKTNVLLDAIYASAAEGRELRASNKMPREPRYA